jgi:type I restriction enzyme S subunit
VTYYRPNASAFLPEFLRLQLASPFVQAQLDAVKSQTTRDFVPISAQYELFLVLPHLEEQREIVRRLDTAIAALDRLEVDVRSAAALVDRLDQAVLAKAFRGDLLPQDPNDEPASVLLERIRTERVAQAKPTARRARRAA